MGQRIPRSLAVVLPALSCLGLLQLGSCGAASDDSPGPSDDAGVASSDASRDRGSSTAFDGSRDTSTESDAPFLYGGPEGWIRWTDYAYGCGFFIPESEQYLPEPIRWEPCPASVNGDPLPGPAGQNCRSMVLDWTPATTGNHITLDAVGDVDESGKVFLAFGRGTGSNYYRIVAEADGPVRFAMYEQGRCAASGPSINAGHFIFQTYDDADGTTSAGGAIAGTIGQLRPIVLRPPGYSKSTDFFSTEYALGPNAFVEFGESDAIYAFPSTALVSPIIQAPEDNGLLYAEYQFHGDDLFWSADSSAWQYVKVWTAAAGIRTLIGYGTDRTRLAGGFGTDGADMVWEEGSGRTDFKNKVYPIVETWTAKYTTDPDVVRTTRRRVRSEYPQTPGNMHNVVGCGYALHANRSSSPGIGWRLVRLSDGMAWDGIAASGARYRFETPLAVTCDEIFLSGFVNGRPNIARVRIDSLGPGTPAD